MSVLLRKKYESIKKEKLSDSGKALLKSMADATKNFKDAKATAKIKPKFLAFFQKLKTSKPEAIKGLSAPKEPSNAKQFKEARERRSGQSGVPQKESDIEKDAGRPAISVKGKRVTDGKHYPYVKGNVYYEYRDNRYDKRPKKYPKLEDGGMMARGGDIKNQYKDGGTRTSRNRTAKDIWESWLDNQRSHFLKDHYDFPTENYVTKEWDELPDDIQFDVKKHIEMGQYADGGMMADGGGIKAVEHFRLRGLGFLKDDLMELKEAIQEKNQEGIDKFFSYWGQHLDALQTTNNERMFNFLKDDLSKLENAIQENDQEQIQMFFSYWEQHLESLKMANGGIMAKGGEPHRIDEIFAEGGSIAQGNNEMLQSQLKAVEHHAKELSSIVNKDTEVEAWVVGKIERAATDLSDITHYLDGRKFAHGGSVDEDIKIGDKFKAPNEYTYTVDEFIGDDEVMLHSMFGAGYQVFKIDNLKRYLQSGRWKRVGEDGGKFADGGSTQGYDDREDERLSMEHGKISSKDFVGSHKEREHSRRDDARFEERMAKGGKLIGKQTKLDVNKNGKLDAEDFKLLRQKAKSRLKK